MVKGKRRRQASPPRLSDRERASDDDDASCESAATEPPKKKTKSTTSGKPWYKQGKKGKRDLLRVVKHKQAHSDERFLTLGCDPDEGTPKLAQYASDDFLAGGEKFMVSRYCNFLLQSILLLTRVFQVPKIIENTYGAGASTSARMALLMMRTTSLCNAAAMRLKSTQRHLYARLLEGCEDKEAVDKMIEAEWQQDRSAAVSERIDEYLNTVVAPQILQGTYPKTNIDCDKENQWDHCWEVQVADNKYYDPPMDLVGLECIYTHHKLSTVLTRLLVPDS